MKTTTIDPIKTRNESRVKRFDITVSSGWHRTRFSNAKK